MITREVVPICKAKLKLYRATLKQTRYKMYVCLLRHWCWKKTKFYVIKLCAIYRQFFVMALVWWSLALYVVTMEVFMPVCVKYQLIQRIEAQTNWPLLFCRQHFQMLFVFEYFYSLIQIPIEFVVKGTINNMPALVMMMTINRRQIIIWIHHALHYKRIYAWFGFNVFIRLNVAI